MKELNIYNYTISVLSAIWSAENIDTVLGIILMTLSIINILWTAGYKIYTSIKNKKLDDVQETIDDAIEQIEELKEDNK